MRRRHGDTDIAVVAMLVLLLPVALHAVTARAQAAPPAIALDPPSAQVGSTVTVDGEGFDPACPVAITFDDEAVTTSSPASDGTFATDFSVPERPPDGYLVVADQRDAGCNPVDREILDVVEFAVDPNDGAVGSTATASGAGFPDAEECGPVVIRFDDEQVAEVATSGFPGDPFSEDLTVPERPPGSYVVEAIQDDPEGCGVRRGTDTFRIPPEPTPTETPSPEPTLTIDPAEGPIETEATAEGDGFDDGVLVQLRFGDVDATTVPPDEVATGSFTVPVVVPEGVPGGPTVVTACQRCDADDERIAATTFLVTPRLALDPDLGPPGIVALAEGDGFAASTLVGMAWQPGIGTTNVTTDEAGELRAPVLVFHRDRLGPRELVATVADEDEATLSVPFLVVPGSGQPREFTT